MAIGDNDEPRVGGRPTKLTLALCKEAQLYADECKDQVEHFESDKGKHWETWRVSFPNIAGLARRLKVSRETIYAWAKPVDNSEDQADTLTPEYLHLRNMFSDTIADIQAEQETRLLNQGLAGVYNPAITKLLLSSKFNYIEKTKTDITSDDKPLPIALVRFIGDEARPDDTEKDSPNS